VQVNQEPALAARAGERRHDHVDAEIPADGAAVDLEVDELIAVLASDLGVARAEDRPGQRQVRNRR
jgi:hypothetical protein